MNGLEPDVVYVEEAGRRTTIPDRPAVFYGSSSFTMWHSLAQDLASDRVVNRGFGGSTLEACVYYFERLITPLQPGSLVLYAGDNDLIHGCSANQVLASFREFVRKLDHHAPGIPFAVMGIKPSPARWHLRKAILRTNAGMEEAIAARGQASLFIDTVAPMLLPNGSPNADLFLEDGVHLSAAGYKVWTELLWPHREQLRMT